MKTTQQQKALLAVSFGTSFTDARKRAIEAVEAELAAAFPDFTLKRAITSHQLSSVKSAAPRAGRFVSEAFKELRDDGFREILIQPFHIIPGFEFEKIKREAGRHAGYFERVFVGKPLLSDDADFKAVAEALRPLFLSLKKDEALLFMGHGSKHAANDAYLRIDAEFRNAGFRSVYVATVEGEPGLAPLIPALRSAGIRKLILQPFMLVAGDHAHNDMAGGDPDSWNSVLSAEGFEVEPRLIGLGEYEAIRKIYVRHALDALSAGNDG